MAIKTKDMKNVNDKLYQEALKEIKEEKKVFEENNLYYNPNSIWHGTLYRHGRFKEATLLKAQIEDMNDFLYFLFEESEHCDHITQSEAYEEFEVYEKLKALEKIKSDETRTVEDKAIA